MTRRELATYLVANIDTPHRVQAVRQAAAWLIEHRRGNEASYLANDVAAIIAQRSGYVAATVTSAHELDADARTGITEFLERNGAREVELTHATDPSLTGGAVVSTPTATADFSLRKALINLRQGDAQ